MAKCRISAEKLSKETGLPPATIKRIRNNANANPTLNTILPIAEYFSLSLSELIGEQSIPMDKIHKKFLTNNPDSQQIPTISWQDALLWPKNRDKILIAKYIYVEPLPYDDLFALEIDDEEKGGDLIPKNATLIIAPNLSPKHKDMALVSTMKGGIPSLKDISFYDNDIYLVPLFKQFPPIKFDKSYRFLGVALQIRLREDN